MRKGEKCILSPNEMMGQSHGAGKYGIQELAEVKAVLIPNTFPLRPSTTYPQRVTLNSLQFTKLFLPNTTANFLICLNSQCAPSNLSSERKNPVLVVLQLKICTFSTLHTLPNSK